MSANAVQRLLLELPLIARLRARFVTFPKYVELGAGQQPWLCSPGQDCLATAASLDDGEAGHNLSWTAAMEQYEPPAETRCKEEEGDALSASGTSVCGAVPKYYPYISSPMFVSEMTTDGYQLSAEGLLGGRDKTTENGLSYIKYLSYLLGSSLNANVINGPNKDRDGLWAPACTDHCMKWKHDSRSVGGLNHYEVFGNWYFNGDRGGRAARSGKTQVIGDWSTAANGTLTASCADTVASSRVVVSTPLGIVAGVSSAAVDVFKGIPFAEAPVGDLRFASPVPKSRWSGTLDATSFGWVCVQGRAPRLYGGEDCLYVNVYRAAGTTSTSNLPVMLWIHGGSFTSGSGRDYDGSTLAREQGVIVITINYRLGPMGFEAVRGGIGQGTGSLNGLHDQITALTWARDNIASFGGDPTTITAFGESAGSLSICMLCVSPLAAGLFDQAILESGDCDHDAAWGIHSESHSQEDMPTVADLRAMTVDEVFASGRGRTAIDGWIVPRHPLDLIQDGGWNPRSVILGGNSYDGLMPWYPESYMPGNRSEWETGMLSTLTRRGFSDAGKQAMLQQYRPERYPIDRDGVPFYRASAAQLDGDLAVVCPTKWLHQKLGQLGIEARMYYFEYGPSCGDKSMNGPWAATMATSPFNTQIEGDRQNVAAGWGSHASEIRFVFGMGDESCHPMTETKFDSADNEGVSARLTKAMQQLFGSFARTGTPTADPSLFTAGDGTWAACGADTQVGASANEPIMIFGSSRVEVINGFKDGDCSLVYDHIASEDCSDTSSDCPDAHGPRLHDVVAKGADADDDSTDDGTSDGGGSNPLIFILPPVLLGLVYQFGCRKKEVAAPGGSIYEKGAAPAPMDSAL